MKADIAAVDKEISTVIGSPRGDLAALSVIEIWIIGDYRKG